MTKPQSATKFQPERLKLHHLAALRRRYPRYTGIFALIMCAVLEICAMQLDNERE